MSTLSCNVTPGKTFVASSAGPYPITPAGLNALGNPTVTVDLANQVAAADLQSSAVETAKINAGAVTEVKLEAATADALHARRVARATYDFAVLGGTVGDKALGVTLPDNAVVTRVWFDVITPVTGGTGATIALRSEAAADLFAATLLATAGTSGFHEGIQTGAASAFVKMTAARELKLSVGVADLTAGKLVVFVEYSVSV